MSEISVIVPVYNAERYLRRCIDFILAQTYHNLEIVLVDDGSTDNSGSICDEYARIDKRVHVIHKENGGNYSARNAGLCVASGEYIGFVDSDDYICAEMYEYLMYLSQHYHSDVVSASYVITPSDSFSFNGNHEEKVRVVHGKDILPFYFAQDCLHSVNDYSVCCKLYRRSVFATRRFAEGELFEDVLFNFEVLSDIDIYVKSSRIVYAYYQGNESVTRCGLSKRHFSSIAMVKKMIAAVDGSTEKELCSLLELKLALTYFSLLAKYVRFGTDDVSMVYDLQKNLRSSLATIVFSNASVTVKLISLCLCVSPRFIRFIYLLLSKNNK